MKSWQIIRYSAVQLMENLGTALRISAVLYFLLIIGNFYYLSQAGNAEVQDGELISFLLSMVVFTFTVPWIAIAWHRFILNDEKPNSFLPKLHFGKMLSYIWRGIVYVFIVLIITILSYIAVLIIGIDFEFGANEFRDKVFFALTMVPSLYVFYRLSPIFPAVALGENISMIGAWRSTGGATGAIFLLLLLDFILVGLPMIYIPDDLSISHVLWTLFPYWFISMFGISAVNTIYLHYVQGRELI